MEAFERAYGMLGYNERCDTSLEPGKCKVAIYADANRKPTHAARQLPSGWWASKLGTAIDIHHELSALEGPAYGKVVIVLARPIH